MTDTETAPPPAESDAAGTAAPPPSRPAAPTVPEPVPPRRGGGGATLGIVLIVVGLVFLAGQFVPGIAWWNLWPMIIVVAGGVQAFTPGKEGWSVHRMFDGFVTVAWGLFFLAITSGMVSWGVFGALLMLWPVLIIAIGFELLGKALHTGWLRVLGSLAIIAGLAYAAAITTAGLDAGILSTVPTGETVSMSEPTLGTSEAELDMEAGAARLTLTDGSELVALDGQSPWGAPTLKVDRSDDSADVRVRLGEGEGISVYPGAPTARLDVALARDVVWDADIAAGAATLDADLSGLDVRSLVLKPGVAECDVKLGAPLETGDGSRVEVRSGVSTVRLTLPGDAPARIEIESGLSGNSVGGDFESVGGRVWETPDFAEAQDAGDPVWVIVVKSGLGSFAVDTY